VDGDLLLDHVAQHFFFDAQLAEQPFVDVAAELLAVGAHLRVVATAEVGHRQVVAIDGGDHFTRGGGDGIRALQKVRDVEDHERQHHEGQAPFQPAPVLTHPVEHRHGVKSCATGDAAAPRPAESRIRNPKSYDNGVSGGNSALMQAAAVLRSRAII
jgi:hypothetical protein